ncbi:MAG: HDOD domain-containing protein, partial [Planctomycetes bacterium]|nr:HDOD domain-containing protein [Planctomycetota bacterium]
MKTILVVDDMAVFREPIAASLKIAGYETQCAENGKEALDVARKTQPDLVLLDVAMPVMDGLEYLAACSNDPKLKNIPVILLTAVSEKDYILKAARFGVKNYLLKSQFSTDDLLKHIEKALNSDTSPQTTTTPPQSQTAIQPPAPAIPQDTTQHTTPAQTPTPTAQTQAQSLEALKELKPIVSRSEIRDLLDSCTELKGLSPTVAQVLKLTAASERCSIDKIVKVIKQDQGIALKILKLANSVVYTRGEHVDSIHKAVMRIGLNEIRQVVLNIAVIDKFSIPNQIISIPNFWEHSIACGLIAIEITRALDEKGTQLDAAFTMGLLHDVGRMVYLDVLGEKYLEVLKTAQSLQLPLEQVESRMLLVNHADAMDRILHSWRFPKELINPIAFHQLSMSLIRGQAATTLSKVAILALANRLAHALLLGSSGNLAIYPTEDFVNALRLKPTVIKHIEEEIPDHTYDMKLSLLASANVYKCPPIIDEIKDQIQTPFRPLYISENPDIDAFRIFCDRLKDTPTEEPSNVAVIQIKKGRERAPLTSKL